MVHISLSIGLIHSKLFSEFSRIGRRGHQSVGRVDQLR
jgi:hypothetical protein